MISKFGYANKHTPQKYSKKQTRDLLLEREEAIEYYEYLINSLGTISDDKLQDLILNKKEI